MNQSGWLVLIGRLRLCYANSVGERVCVIGEECDTKSPVLLKELGLQYVAIVILNSYGLSMPHASTRLHN